MLGLRKTTATPRERKVGIIGEESPRPSSSRIIKKASTGGVKKPAAKKAMRKVVDAMVGIKRRRKSRAPSVQITEEELDARTWSENLTHHDMERLGVFVYSNVFFFLRNNLKKKKKSTKTAIQQSTSGRLRSPMVRCFVNSKKHSSHPSEKTFSKKVDYNIISQGRESLQAFRNHFVYKVTLLTLYVILFLFKNEKAANSTS